MIIGAVALDRERHRDASEVDDRHQELRRRYAQMGGCGNDRSENPLNVVLSSDRAIKLTIGHRAAKS
jgi:hypothetical protein